MSFANTGSVLISVEVITIIYNGSNPEPVNTDEDEGESTRAHEANSPPPSFPVSPSMTDSTSTSPFARPPAPLPQPFSPGNGWHMPGQGTSGSTYQQTPSTLSLSPLSSSLGIYGLPPDLQVHQVESHVAFMFGVRFQLDLSTSQTSILRLRINRRQYRKRM